MRGHIGPAVTLLMAAACAGCGGEARESDPAFERTTLFSHDPDAAPWAKFTGDLDADGVAELFVGYNGNGDIVRIRHDGRIDNPLIRQHAVQTDGGVADIDADGVADIALLTRHGLFAFFGPDYAAMQLSPERLHDLRFVDEDGDGRLEIVVRNQTAFGNGSGDVRILSGERGRIPWNERTVFEAQGEGIDAADIDGDGDLDIALPGTWLENLGAGKWLDHDFAPGWDWPHAKVSIADVDADGRRDVLLAPAEPAGERYKIAWYRQPEDPTQAWTEHVLVGDVESVVHSLQAGDVDLDGDVDVVYAEMHQGADPDDVMLLENRGMRAWRHRLIDTVGSHNVQLFDRDGDGAPDIAGANWDGEDQHVYLWRNTVCDEPWTGWSRHVIDDRRPGQAVFVLSGDLDGDGWPDVVSGSVAYLSDGEGGWRRIRLGDERVDAALVWDADSDGDLDILAAVDDPAKRRFELRRNDGNANFTTIDTGVELSGDFLQGVSVLDDGRHSGVLLSWHAPGLGVERLSPPGDGGREWRLERVSDVSQDEALSAADVDDDGEIDVVLGTRWLRNEGDAWTPQVIDATASRPDRNVVADMDGDGDGDVVVGFEAESVAGDVAWYEREGDAWQRHDVGTVIGPMSLGVADMDADGDLDIIVGEHHLADPDAAVLWIFENYDGLGRNWRPHRIHTGDEHHDGAHVVDIDLDGDPDIVSIGWGHGNVTWYENRIPACRTNSPSSK